MLIEFKVIFDVDGGNPETYPLKDAILEGINRANDEGYLTPLDNEEVTVKGWTVAHVSTKEG